MVRVTQEQKDLPPTHSCLARRRLLNQCSPEAWKEFIRLFENLLVFAYRFSTTLSSITT